MAEAGNGGNHGGGDESVCPMDEIENPRAQIDVRATEGAGAISGAEDLSSGGGDGGHAEGADGSTDRCTPKVEEHTPVLLDTGGPWVHLWTSGVVWKAWWSLAEALV